MSHHTEHHPIEILLAILLATFESLCWLINELAGFHKQSPPPHPASPEPAPITTTTEPTPMTNPASPEPVMSVNEQWMDYVHTLTVKQLQTLVGTRNSRLRKADLIRLAVCY